MKWLCFMQDLPLLCASLSILSAWPDPRPSKEFPTCPRKTEPYLCVPSSGETSFPVPGKGVNPLTCPRPKARKEVSCCQDRVINALRPSTPKLSLDTRRPSSLQILAPLSCTIPYTCNPRGRSAFLRLNHNADNAVVGVISFLLLA